MRLLFAVALFLLACAARDTSLESGVRSANNVLTDVGDPACAVAKQTCLLRQELALSRAEAGERAQRDVFRQITARCSVVMEACDTIRRGQLAVKQLLDEGQLQAAQEEVTRVREVWRGLSLDGGIL